MGEIANLSLFLDRQRDAFARKAGDLDADQLARTLPPSDLTLGGMVKHLAFVEDWWFGRHLLDAQSEPWASVDWRADPDWDWHSAADDSPQELWSLWDRSVARSRAAVEADPRPDRRCLRSHHGHGAQDGLELRWVMGHMVEEYARHVGHADLIRQSVDGSVGD